jgi:3-phosphoshikimate 1-carboxyvinyltransferase
MSEQALNDVPDLELIADEAGTQAVVVATDALEAGTIEIRRSKRLRGNASFTGDAHLSMLACGIAALSDEAVRLENLPDAPWFHDFRASLEMLGVTFNKTADGHTLVHGGGLHSPEAPVPVGHELAALIFAGLGSGLRLNLELKPDPVHVPGDVVALLNALYPVAEPALEGLIRVGELHAKARGACIPSERRQNGQAWDEPMTKIVLLFHHLAARESLDLQLKRPGSDLLENLLIHFEIALKVERDDDKDADELTRRIARQMRAAGKQEPMTRIRLPAGAKPHAAFVALAGDVTEAAAIALAATLIKGSDVMLEGVCLNPGRSTFFSALRRLGGDVEVVQRREKFGDTLGSVRVRASEGVGRRFDDETLSNARDEVYLLLVAAAFAEGESVFRDLNYLRGDHPRGSGDRPDTLRAFTASLKQTGVEIGEIEDGLVIRGRPDYDGGAYDALGHAGLAAAYAVLAAKSHGASTLKGVDALDRRHPTLRERLRFLGIPE